MHVSENNAVYIYIYIIIILTCSQHEYTSLSRQTSLSFIAPAGLSGYTPYLHGAAVCRFVQVAKPLLGHVKGSTAVHCL